MSTTTMRNTLFTLLITATLHSHGVYAQWVSDTNPVGPAVGAIVAVFVVLIIISVVIRCVRASSAQDRAAQLGNQQNAASRIGQPQAQRATPQVQEPLGQAVEINAPPLYTSVEPAPPTYEVTPRSSNAGRVPYNADEVRGDDEIAEVDGVERLPRAHLAGGAGVSPGYEEAHELGGLSPYGYGGGYGYGYGDSDRNRRRSRDVSEEERLLQR